MPLHVSSTMCSSSGGQNFVIQHLVSWYQQVKIVLCSIWYHDTSSSKLYYAASGIVIPAGQNSIIQRLVSWYQQVRIVLYSIWYHDTSRSKLCYTASRIMIPAGQNYIIRHLVSWYQKVKIVLYSIWYHDTRCCIIQFWPPDDEHIVLETCRGI